LHLRIGPCRPAADGGKGDTRADSCQAFIHRLGQSDAFDLAPVAVRREQIESILPPPARP
jgi:hypothetical protein